MDDKQMEILKTINIDNYERYIEVMIGEGQSLSILNPRNSCYLNDSNTDLINFYKNLDDPELKHQLELFAKNWNLLEQFSVFSTAEILMAFNDFNEEIITSDDLTYVIRAIIMMNMDHENFNSLFEQDFIVSIDLFSNALIKAIEGTLIKLKGCPSEKETDTEILKEEIKYSFKLGFYEHFKNLINFQKTELIDCLKLNKHLAIWYFLKEHTKGQQLQYDQNGNLKNQFNKTSNDISVFTEKINSICNSQFIDIIKKASLYNNTPTDFINTIKPIESDILILNLQSNNIVLSSGKNTIRNQNHQELIKQILNLNSSFIIITKDDELVELCRSNNESTIKIESLNGNHFAFRLN